MSLSDGKKNVPESIARKAHDVSYALKRVLKLDVYTKDASRVSVPKALAADFVARYGKSVRWEQHERGLLLVPAFPIPSDEDVAWQHFRTSMRIVQEAGYPLDEILEVAQAELKVTA